MAYVVVSNDNDGAESGAHLLDRISRVWKPRHVTESIATGSYNYRSIIVVYILQRVGS